MNITPEYSRIAIEIVDRSRDQGRPSERGYLEVGHRGGDSDRFFLWVWRGGKIETHRDPDLSDNWEEEYQGWLNEPGSIVHEHVWNEEELENLYRGRYDADTGHLSVLIPLKWEHREVPNSLLSALYKKFPGVNKVFVF